MNQEINQFIEQNLLDAHNIFHHIIREMKHANIKYPYDELIQKEQESYEIVRNDLRQMQSKTDELNSYKEFCNELSNDKFKLYLKYFSLYLVSLVFMKIFYEIYNTEDFSKFYNYVVGLLLGSVYAGLLNKDINDLNANDKDTRDLLNRIKTLKEEYKECHDNAVIEINYIFAVNGNLWEELDKGRVLVKNM